MNSEATLLSTIQEIKKASFSKTSLKFFKEIPETVRIVLKTSASSDNEKLLAMQAYGEFFKKMSSFAKDIKEKKIVPSNEELNECEDVVNITYESNKDLLNTFPEFANATKINEIQPVLSDLKTVIQQMKSETPPKEPNDDNPPNDLERFYLVIDNIW